VPRRGSNLRAEYAARVVDRTQFWADAADAAHRAGGSWNPANAVTIADAELLSEAKWFREHGTRPPL
jgi:hypothetical protein